VPVRRPRQWSPRTPNLYRAEIEATAGGRRLDRARLHFGMRALGVERGHLALNKRPLWLRGSNLVHEWSGGGEFRDVKRYIVDEAREMNLNSFRTHTLPPPTHWANVADAHGIMLLAEFPVTYNYRDFGFTPEQQERFRRNVLADATGWITKLWNHPSIVAWVLSNEPRGDTEWEIGPYQELVRALDPTRLIVRTGDEAGTDDLVSIHPTLNYTNAHDGELALMARRAAAAKDPRRALGNTEYMNYLGSRAEIVTRRLGRPDHPEAALEFAEVAAEDTEVMRRLGFDVILPYMYADWTRFRGNSWRLGFATPMAAALHSAMAPVLASWELFDRNFVAARRVRTDLVLINETDTTVPVRVDVYVTPAHPLFVPDEAALARTVFRQRIRRTLPAQSRSSTAVEWSVPARPGTYYLAAVLRRPDQQPVVSQRVVRAVAPPELPPSRRPTEVVLLGADRTLERWFDRMGIGRRGLGGSDQRPASRIVVGGRLVAESSDDGVTQGLLDAVAGGARLLVLDPRRWSWPRLADFTIGPGLPTSRVFAYGAAGQDLLSGIHPHFFTRWNGLPGTLTYGFVSSGAPDLEPVMWGNNPKEPVLVRIPHGRGEIVVALLRIVSRLDPASESYDPVAEWLLINLIQH
jgi:Glycosyl hydrolases family 2, TIM barrel domain/Glycosyl hydrolases family 2